MSIEHHYQKIHEPVTVIVSNPDNKWHIHKFKWRDSEYRVEAVTLRTRAMRGQQPVWLFSVATQSGSYQLRLDTYSLQWWLEKVYSQWA